MSKTTIFNQACNNVEGFAGMGEHFMRQLVINGNSKSTHENYLRQMAKLALHYGKSPLNMEVIELEEYLYFLMQKEIGGSQSAFKHLVYGLRKLYLLYDKEALHVSLPQIPHSGALPVVLSGPEVKAILRAFDELCHRVIFGLAYDTGLRISELVNLLIGDVDLNRKMVHVRESKCKKDRYIVLSGHMVRGIKKHLTLNNPSIYLFEHPVRKGIPTNPTMIRNILKNALQKTGIKKSVCVHTFRHTYATHQLEAGQNIVAVKEALGHVMIQTTLMYLHIAKIDPNNRFGCLDKLYEKQD
jgi:site-specific recombinase XerD